MRIKKCVFWCVLQDLFEEAFPYSPPASESSASIEHYKADDEEAPEPAQSLSVCGDGGLGVLTVPQLNHRDYWFCDMESCVEEIGGVECWVLSVDQRYVFLLFLFFYLYLFLAERAWRK